MFRGVDGIKTVGVVSKLTPRAVRWLAWREDAVNAKRGGWRNGIGIHRRVKLVTAPADIQVHCECQPGAGGRRKQEARGED